jgi:hypothetical protein
VGDRGNIAILYKVGDGGDEQYSLIYLYTHWGGSQIAQVLQDALRRSAPNKETGDLGRWFDPAYLARIIFDSLKADEEDGILGFGIAPYVEDNDHPILAVDVYHQEVFVLPEGFGGHRPAGDLWRSLGEAQTLGPGQEQARSDGVSESSSRRTSARPPTRCSTTNRARLPTPQTHFTDAGSRAGATLTPDKLPIMLARIGG